MAMKCQRHANVVGTRMGTPASSMQRACGNEPFSRGGNRASSDPRLRVGDGLRLSSRESFKLSITWRQGCREIAAWLPMLAEQAYVYLFEVLFTAERLLNHVERERIRIAARHGFRDRLRNRPAAWTVYGTDGARRAGCCSHCMPEHITLNRPVQMSSLDRGSAGTTGRAGEKAGVHLRPAEH